MDCLPPDRLALSSTKQQQQQQQEEEGAPGGGGVNNVDMDSIRRKRLIYRAKQRGWLEVDLLLGTWASQHVPTLLNSSELDDFEAFVNMETIDIYNIITLKTAPDPDASNYAMMKRIQDWARGNPLGKADPDAYKTVKENAKLI